VPQALPTEGTEFGLLLKTPTVMDGEVTSGKKNPISGNSGTLAQEIMSEFNPTMMKLGMLPTPNAFDWNTGRTKEKWEEDKKKYEEKGVNLHMSLRQGARLMSGKPSQLSPLFVEEMMGFPKNWTALPFQSGEENQSKHMETL